MRASQQRIHSLLPWTRATALNAPQIRALGKGSFLVKHYLMPGLLVAALLTSGLALAFRSLHALSIANLGLGFGISALLIGGWSTILGMRQWSRAEQLGDGCEIRSR